MRDKRAVLNWLLESDEPAIRYRTRINAVDSGLLKDPRATDALDLLESKQRPDGRFQAGRAWWQRPTNATSAVDVIDWGKGRPSEVLTLQALAVLKAAGR